MARSISGAQQLVARFHEKVLPRGITPQQQMLKLIEEVGELARGLHKDDDVLIADALGDCLYVLLGIANQCHVQLDEVFDEVHASNMTKTRDGTMSPKGDGFVPPRLCNACCLPANELINGMCGPCVEEARKEES